MSSQPVGPGVEAPPSLCPICLEPWDTSGRLPKFLSCHHSVCLSCVTVLHGAHAPSPRPAQPMTPAGPLARILGSRQDEEPDPSSWVRCPLCRTPTQVVDPSALQTNFYLHSASLPRLSVWCEDCCCVARPDCLHHRLTPLPHKMRRLMEDVQTQVDEVYVWSCDRAAEYEGQMAVYNWLCGLLRHAHDHLFSTLSQTQASQQIINQQADHLQDLVKRSESLASCCQDAGDEAIKELLQLADEVKRIHKGTCGAEAGGPSPPGSVQTFRLPDCPRGPMGYRRARVLLQAGDHLTLSFSGEEQPEEEDAEGVGRRKEAGGRRFHTLQGKRREAGAAPPAVPVRRAASLHHAPPQPSALPATHTTALDAPAAWTQPPAWPQAGLSSPQAAVTSRPDTEPAKPAVTGEEWAHDTSSSDADTPEAAPSSARHTRADDGRGRGRGAGRNHRRRAHPPHRSSKPKCCVV